MGKITLILSAIMLLTACGQKDPSPSPTPPVPNPGVAIEEDFQPFIDRFKEVSLSLNSSVSVTNLIVQYDSSLNGTNVLGVCTTWTGHMTPTITINPVYWKAWANQGRASEMEQLIFHEMGHCVLNRPHDSTKITSSDLNTLIEVSIMNPYHLNKQVYEGNYSYYLEELFFPNIAGTVSLYSSGTSGFPIHAYASTQVPEESDSEVHTFTAKASSLNPTEATIDQFGCEDNH